MKLREIFSGTYPDVFQEVMTKRPNCSDEYLMSLTQHMNNQTDSLPKGMPKRLVTDRAVVEKMGEISTRSSILSGYNEYIERMELEKETTAYITVVDIRKEVDVKVVAYVKGLVLASATKNVERTKQLIKLTYTVCYLISKWKKDIPLELKHLKGLTTSELQGHYHNAAIDLLAEMIENE